MSIGDRVRVVRVSPHIGGEVSLYEECVGRTFAVEGFDGDGWVELDVGSVTGRPFELLVIEPEYLEVIEPAVA